MFRPRRSSPGQHVDAVHDFAANTVSLTRSQLASFQQTTCEPFMVRSVLAVLVHWLKMDAQKTYVSWLNRNTENRQFSGRGLVLGRLPHISAEVRAVWQHRSATRTS